MAVRDERPDLVLLDVMMPHLDGLEVCRRMRADGDRTPVLMLTARQEVPDRVAGLDAGADDYLPKPFDLTELLARVRALLRRSSPGDSVVLRVGELQLDPARRVVTVGGRPVDLTRTEFAVLKMLLENPDVVLERSPLLPGDLGLRLRAGLPEPRRPRRLPPPEARSHRPGADDRDRARGRVRHSTRRGLRSMLRRSLRARLAVGLAATVALSVLLTSAVTVVSTTSLVNEDVDDYLRQQAEEIERGRAPEGRPGPDGLPVPAGYGGARTCWRRARWPTTSSSRSWTRTPRWALRRGVALPVEQPERDFVERDQPLLLRTVTVDGQRYRMLTDHIAGGGAVQLAVSLEATDDLLASIRPRAVAIGGRPQPRGRCGRPGRGPADNPAPRRAHHLGGADHDDRRAARGLGHRPRGRDRSTGHGLRHDGPRRWPRAVTSNDVSFRTRPTSCGRPSPASRRTSISWPTPRTSPPKSRRS